LISFLDLKAPYGELREEIEAAVLRATRSGWYILGPEVQSFENDFAEYCGAAHAIGLGNGLDALHLALLALGVSPGDEVIVPSNTYIATWLAVSQCGAKPVPVEPDSRTYNIDPAAIEAAITARTRVILPVHLYGQPADMDAILAVARRRGIRVLEDAAQAHGARYKGRRIGAHGDAVAWSFYPTKNLGAFGDAGAVTTDDAAVADRVRLLRNYGSRTKYVNETRGYNSRLDPMQAAILRVKLKYLDDWNSRRAQLAAQYQRGLSECDLVRPHVPEWAQPVWHVYVIRHRRRDALQARLESAGVGTLVHYPVPPHLQEAYADHGWEAGDFPLASQMAREVLSLPMGTHLSAKDVDEVISAIREGETDAGRR
jgi:dTDP-4-amino-4,6-dideoxygalactose transaminase